MGDAPAERGPHGGEHGQAPGGRPPQQRVVLPAVQHQQLQPVIALGLKEVLHLRPAVQPKSAEARPTHHAGPHAGPTNPHLLAHGQVTHALGGRPADHLVVLKHVALDHGHGLLLQDLLPAEPVGEAPSEPHRRSPHSPALGEVHRAARTSGEQPWFPASQPGPGGDTGPRETL